MTRRRASTSPCGTTKGAADSIDKNDVSLFLRPSAALHDCLDANPSRNVIDMRVHGVGSCCGCVCSFLRCAGLMKGENFELDYHKSNAEVAIVGWRYIKSHLLITTKNMGLQLTYY